MTLEIPFYRYHWQKNKPRWLTQQRPTRQPTPKIQLTDNRSQLQFWVLTQITPTGGALPYKTDPKNCNTISQIFHIPSSKQTHKCSIIYNIWSTLQQLNSKTSTRRCGKPWPSGQDSLGWISFFFSLSLNLSPHTVHPNSLINHWLVSYN